jgi:two-component system chemotaxis sensor kinase CheA
LTLTFSDDGAGIDADRRRAAALKKGFPPESLRSEDDILQTVFLASISTRAEAGMLSGRGIGLAAVKEEAEKRGGSAFITSKRGEGTTLSVCVVFKQP